MVEGTLSWEHPETMEATYLSLGLAALSSKKVVRQPRLDACLIGNV